ncbi:MAG: succinylglutamate desuccinylase/aspartoacylase family protein, partial [Anaerolineales bacterium]|nr:succinylglutamate desuccinylase/aspartoacylase family protein [Anaerolineales bacterium]
MSENLVVGKLSARLGETVTGVNTFEINGEAYHLPVYLINGAEEGPTLVLTGGVHAAEYASIAAALELGQTLNPKEIKGQVIVVPVINQAGFPVRSIYVNPMDGVNLNRVFPGKADGGISEQIAAWVFENVMKQGDYYIDLHGGDLVEALVPFTIFPETGDEKVDKDSLALAEVFGIEYLVRKVGGSGSTFTAVAAAGIPAILVESGGQGIWPRQDVVRLIEGVQRVMTHFGMVENGDLEPVKTKVLEHFIWLRSEHDGFWYPAVEVGDQVAEGQVLGVVKDVWGNVL